ncbi:F0F1 ATP synthase subunit delta [Nocardioides coralli]|uniref:F0F1 ATP synthase subunit delta n=1 Tax=Nocardioides coralli TaxID=2872154 RepID=UPI001CA40954|nr:F0F1 ATP synthase subunit delta [Nocardioides coralli]QZY30192.1 F0F1 ATP synthase subunit delta [Nocardioides coralli]
MVSAMRGASAEAQAELLDRLTGALGSADAASVGTDLFGAASVIRSEAGLRRVVTDISTPGEAKATLVTGIFEGKLDPVALDLVVDAVRRRWTATRDLADTLEHLGVVALVRSAGDADAERLSDELFGVGRLVEENPDLRAALSDHVRSVADRRQLVRGLLGDRTLPATVALAEQALAGSYRTFGVAIAEYQKIAAAVHDERVARVRVAQELSDDDRQRLEQALSRQYGRDVHLNVVVEPELLGGMRVEIGDDVIDGTVVSRLDEARRKLAG